MLYVKLFKLVFFNSVILCLLKKKFVYIIKKRVIYLLNYITVTIQ